MEKNINLFALKKQLSTENRKVKNKNVFMLFDEGKDKFSLAEIIDKSKGIYIVLGNNQIVVGQPFTGYARQIDKFYKVYDEHSDMFTYVDEAYYEDIRRDDNAVFSKMGHMYSSRTSYVYTVLENMHNLTNNKTVFFSSQLYFGDFGETREPFKFCYYDKDYILKGNVRPIEKWLEFEKDLNKIYNHYLHTGKNYLQEDEEIILKEKEKFSKQTDETVKKCEKLFGIVTRPEGTVEQKLEL